MEVPQVKQVFAVHLCPQKANTRWNRLRFPFQSLQHYFVPDSEGLQCCLTDRLALHAMTVLQVHHPKALKELHEGCLDPGLMQKLH